MQAPIHSPGPCRVRARQNSHRSRQQARISVCPKAIATQTAYTDLQRVESIVRKAGGWSPPALTGQPEVLLYRNVPFLTRQAGSLPTKPRNLDHALHIYGSYTSKYVSVRVENVHVKLHSWDHAVETLVDAEDRKKPYWCSLIEHVQHPAWWPTDGHVPTYDQVIFGRGNASIGLHFDKDNACAGGSRTPVSTYLAITEGTKLTLLLPPDQTLLPAGGDPDLLLNPTPQFLQDVKAAGGYHFLLEDLANASKGSSSGSSRNPGRYDAFSATALYMPAGWYHWLVGLTDWHVVYGGSFYPKQQVGLQ